MKNCWKFLLVAKKFLFVEVGHRIVRKVSLDVYIHVHILLDEQAVVEQVKKSYRSMFVLLAIKISSWCERGLSLVTGPLLEIPVDRVAFLYEAIRRCTPGQVHLAHVFAVVPM